MVIDLDTRWNEEMRKGGVQMFLQTVGNVQLDGSLIKNGQFPAGKRTADYFLISFHQIESYRLCKAGTGPK